MTPNQEHSSEGSRPGDDEWDVMFVLPNLEAPERRWVRPPKESSGDLLEEGITLGSAFIAITSQEDHRVKTAVERSPVVRKLLEGFQDELGKRAFPPVLIVSRAPALVETSETLTAFRNAVALAVVLRNRAAWITNGGGQTPNWTDHFDFHPAQTGRDGVLTISPALRKYGGSGSPFHAMPSPHVSDSVERLHKDSFLYRALGVEWRELFEVQRAESQFARVLFRSLEIAYIAAATPTKNGASAQEWGIGVALWVSAMETLAWTEQKKVNALAVLDLLAEFDWGEMNTSLTAPFACRRLRGEARELSRVQFAYLSLYDARNAFLHGDKVSPDLLQPWGADDEVPSLPAMAAVLYRTALAGYLRRKHATEWLVDAFDDQEYADAFNRCYGLLDQ